MPQTTDRVKTLIAESLTIKAYVLYDTGLVERIAAAASLITETIKKGGKVLIFGNGGSAADSQHFATELVGRFRKERRALPAIALTTDTSALTALANDYSFDVVFSRQIEALAGPKDLAFAISTSGQAKNVLQAIRLAKKIGAKTIGLTGKGGGPLAKNVDCALVVPSENTARVQEIHILIIHIICELVEEAFSTSKK